MKDVLRIALVHAPFGCRKALTAFWNYDAALGRVVATTTEPMIGQMRLTWWHDRLVELDGGIVPAEPIIVALQDVVVDNDITGSMLAALVEGWEALLEPLPLGDDTLREFALMRGDRLFDLSARILDADVARGLGAGWALIDFATHCSDRVTAERAWAMAGDCFRSVDMRGPKPLRILARLASAKTNQPFDKLASPVSGWTLLRAVLP